MKMVESQVTGVRYALKCVRKQSIVEQGQQQALVTERAILAEVDHPFIIKFVRSFRSPTQVYFLTELVSGGELLDVLHVLGLLQPAQARFYAASIILALEYLHARCIAYLDLKSENCLIDNHGYLKLIDFGIAQRITQRSYVVKGTPMFMAPEMILLKGYNTSADLWALGVCMYEFVFGTFPFGSTGTTPKEIYNEVVKAPLRFPSLAYEHPGHEDTVSLIRGLLVRHPSRRLGAGAEGFSVIKEHSFFDGFCWDELLGRGLEPPHIPSGETYAEDKDNDHIADRISVGSRNSVVEVEAASAAEDSWTDQAPGWDADF